MILGIVFLLEMDYSNMNALSWVAIAVIALWFVLLLIKWFVRE
ncbi:hypothetical protein [Paenibacillus sp. GbtcB18]|nr:hypothetical protein [Paenibacillus sp. GbtcB18]